MTQAMSVQPESIFAVHRPSSVIAFAKVHILVDNSDKANEKMTSNPLIAAIERTFGMVPTAHQRQALETFSRFMADRDERTMLILRGSAGTGKTSLASAFVRTLARSGYPFVLLAPTGRAAKVFSLNSGQPASTIHRCIYRQKTMDIDGGAFALNYNKLRRTLFFVDEASMINNAGMGDTGFGTGCLLDDLVEFVYSGTSCRLVLIGDTAQLPPVGESQSPALTASVMSAYGLHVYECDLHEVLRQSRESGILFNATLIREMIARDHTSMMPPIRLQGFADICLVQGNELIEMLTSSYDRAGMDETMVITRSNKRANIYNKGIRQAILGREEELERGDMLMVVRNKYIMSACTSSKAEEALLPGHTSVSVAEEPPMQFIANGDRARVLRVRRQREVYGFHFADVLLDFPDYSNKELQATVITDSLHSDAPALTKEQNENLFMAVLNDYADIPTKAERMKKVREDCHFSALQVKYAYAITCHKAQGGQWQHVYLDQGYMTDDMLNSDYFHWLYTAFTRATEKLFLVNWPQKALESR